MANIPGGPDGEKITDGVRLVVYLSPSQRKQFEKRAFSRMRKRGRADSLAQIAREILLEDEPGARPKKAAGV